MSARVGMSGSEGKPAVETKRQKAFTFPSYLGESEGEPGPPILYAAWGCWSCWRSAQVSNDFNLRFRLFPRV